MIAVNWDRRPLPGRGRRERRSAFRRVREQRTMHLPVENAMASGYLKTGHSRESGSADWFGTAGIPIPREQGKPNTRDL